MLRSARQPDAGHWSHCYRRHGLNTRNSGAGAATLAMDAPEYKRPFVAAGLTLQMLGGAVIGFAAQAFLVWGPIFHLMP